MKTEVITKARNRLPEVGEAFECYDGRTYLRINDEQGARALGVAATFPGGLYAVNLATGNMEWWTNPAAEPLKLYPLEPEGGAVRFVRKA